MSTAFFIRDSHNKGCITVGQALDIGQDFSQYTVQKDTEEYAAFLKERINRFECITLGKDRISARGYQIYFLRG